MRPLRTIVKLWFVIAILSAVVVACWVASPSSLGHIYVGNEPVSGPLAVLFAAGLAAVGIFVAGLVFSILIVLLALAVPLAVFGILLLVLVPVAAVVVVALGGVTLLFSPILLVLAVCVLLGRILIGHGPRRRRDPPPMPAR